MAWLKSRRLQYLLAITALFFGLMVILRAMFYFGFSEVPATPNVDQEAVLAALGVGLRFDLRLALLMMLPLAALAYLPRFNLLTSGLMRALGHLYLIVALGLLVLTYIFDFGHYAYLGERLNVTALRFLQDTRDSTLMVWESYPVIWITLGWIASVAGGYWLARVLERKLLERSAAGISGMQATLGFVVCFALFFFAILGRVSNINILNPIPLRWSEAFVSGDRAIGALGLNPVLYFRDTLLIPVSPYDKDKVAEYYPLMADHLGIPQDQRQSLNFVRQVEIQSHKLDYDRPPNVVFIMLESLGASRVSSYGLPIESTPNLDRLAAEGWRFKNFYVPVTGTAKTIWATFTGIPDVAPTESASRNPLTSHQRTVVNEFEGYRNFYFIGGNAGWANLDGLVQQSIDDLELYQEGDWESPDVDVWGISDLNLFRESNQILADVPDDQPFFAFIQTAGNHRPFTIPDNNGDFEPRTDLSEEELAKHGFRSAAQYNAVRLLDYNVGEYMKWARESDYFDNTIFVFFGDHSNRITTLPHMPAMDQLGLESNHVPHIIYAPRYLSPREIDDSVGLVDVLPSIAGMLGLNYRNTTLGRDFQTPAPEGERASFVVLLEGPNPVYGMVTRNFLVRMNADGSNATLHDLHSDTPKKDVSAAHPETFKRLFDLARAEYETARFMMYDNVDD
ncbi:MAG: LTA synthase family protein [Pseudomonadota bacterium]|uniref:LTA synthase family protein n=1 Tax=Alcanivorax sp. TaxID=1872427 RepID=UPI00243AD2BB|nr:LTA synthase family protein [Alcanivorax sp.]MED5239432.1 LTA synthase family protein [Pseudomonadota bacterium]MEE3322008.1 LTA synthase family protein [Pseudomonadota bacterium]